MVYFQELLGPVDQGPPVLHLIGALERKKTMMRHRNQHQPKSWLRLFGTQEITSSTTLLARWGLALKSRVFQSCWTYFNSKLSFTFLGPFCTWDHLRINLHICCLYCRSFHAHFSFTRCFCIARRWKPGSPFLVWKFLSGQQFPKTSCFAFVVQYLEHLSVIQFAESHESRCALSGHLPRLHWMLRWGNRDMDRDPKQLPQAPRTRSSYYSPMDGFVFRSWNSNA